MRRRGKLRKLSVALLGLSHVPATRTPGEVPARVGLAGVPALVLALVAGLWLLALLVGGTVLWRRPS